MAHGRGDSASRRTIKEKVHSLMGCVDELEASAGRWKIHVRGLRDDVFKFHKAMEALTAAVAIVFAKTESLGHKFGYWASTLQAAWDAWCRNWAPEGEPDVELAD